MNDQAPGRGAALPTGAHGTEYDRPDGHIQIGMRGDDNGIIAPQLEQGPAQAGSYRLSYFFAHPGGTGSRQQGQAAIMGHQAAQHRIPDYQVEDSFGQIILP